MTIRQCTGLQNEAQPPLYCFHRKAYFVMNVFGDGKIRQNLILNDHVFFHVLMVADNVKRIRDRRVHNRFLIHKSMLQKNFYILQFIKQNLEITIGKRCISFG